MFFTKLKTIPQFWRVLQSNNTEPRLFHYKLCLKNSGPKKYEILREIQTALNACNDMTGIA